MTRLTIPRLSCPKTANSCSMTRRFRRARPLRSSCFRLLSLLPATILSKEQSFAYDRPFEPVAAEV